MADIGAVLRNADVRAIYLVHGTFVGADALGIIREVACLSPSFAAPLRRLEKRTADTIARDAGNYTQAYAISFENAINEAHERSIPIRIFSWSSENHHIGRADGAVRLLHELASREELRGGRVLLWGHSHGGNVFALLTNLLANPPRVNNRFFRAARSYYRWPIWGKTDMPVWRRVKRMLHREDHPVRSIKLDLVTLGTPVRYGWDTDGCSNLLHVINHRPVEGLPQHLAPFPPNIDNVLAATAGDYIQQLGIAGTNFTPPFWAWRAWISDIRLGRLLQAGLRKRDTLARLKLGVRVHKDGETLLVDYGPAKGNITQHLAGHAVYTRLDWLLFHAEEVTRRFYCEADSSS
jgi:hypothetical protein